MSKGERSKPFTYTRVPGAVPETWDVTCRRTRLHLGKIRKDAEQTAAYQAKRPKDFAFAGPFASLGEAALWMRDSKTGPIHEGDRV